MLRHIRLSLELQLRANGEYLGKRNYVTFALIMPSQILMSIFLLYPTRGVELFGNVLHHLIARDLGSWC